MQEAAWEDQQTTAGLLHVYTRQDNRLASKTTTGGATGLLPCCSSKSRDFTAGTCPAHWVYTPGLFVPAPLRPGSEEAVRAMNPTRGDAEGAWPGWMGWGAAQARPAPESSTCLSLLVPGTLGGPRAAHRLGLRAVDELQQVLHPAVVHHALPLRALVRFLRLLFFPLGKPQTKLLSHLCIVPTCGRGRRLRKDGTQLSCGRLQTICRHVAQRKIRR